MHRLQAVVAGRVQGVGFRAFVLRHARSLGLSGTVRNRSDGAVEVDARGTRQALGTLLEQLRRGPGGARVDAVDELWGETNREEDGFHIGGS